VLEQREERCRDNGHPGGGEIAVVPVQLRHVDKIRPLDAVPATNCLV
jgi:hypothetical protein